MEHSERADARMSCDAWVTRHAAVHEGAEAHGAWTVECHGPDGELKWVDHFPNVVCTEGKNLAFDAFLAGSGYTVTGPFVGLISSVGYTAVAAGDTGAQINGANGWKEAGGANLPTFSGLRPIPTWAAATGGAKAFAAAVTWSITASGTLKGLFILYGGAATHTPDSAAGNLWSTGLFAGGDKTVGNGDTVSGTYSTSM
jgi:hypothetical protein